MKRRLRPVLPVVMGCLMVVLGACDLQEPERYIRAPVIKNYAPRASAITAAVGDSLRFSIDAIDPNQKNLSYRFMLADSLAASTPLWIYVVHDTGTVDVEGCVSNDGSQSAIRWRLTRVLPVNLPPEIVDVSPQESEVTIIVGDAMEFAVTAVDPEGKPLSYAYTIGDSIVGASRRYIYQSTFVGVVDIRALVTDGESFVSHIWTLRVAAEPDSIPPAAVVLTAIAPGPGTGEVDIEWTAVGDDDMTGVPSYYIVRTSPVPISDEHGWNSSSNREGEPDPAPPGATMRMTVRDLPPAQTVYIAVRAVDDFGLISPFSPGVSTRARGMKISGSVQDAGTGLPVEGIRVKLLQSVDTTGVDGSFLLTELPGGQSFIRMEDESFRTEIGDYFDIVISPYTIVDNDVWNVGILPNVQLDTDQYEDLLEFYMAMTDVEGYTDLLPRWDLPCQVYVPPFVEEALDYEQVIKNAFREWEGLIGRNVFRFVEAVPDTGVFVEYTRPEGRDYYIVTARAPNGLPLQGRINIRTGYAGGLEQVMQVVVLHEIGHAIGLNHSLDDMHLMMGGIFPQVQHPSDDEVHLIRAVYRIPRGFPAAWFLRD